MATAKKAAKKTAAKKAPAKTKKLQVTKGKGKDTDAATSEKPAAAKKAAAPRGSGGTLVIVESPAKAKTIKKYLGSGFTVKASVGHVKDLPKKKMGIDIDNDFQPEYFVIDGKKKVLDEITAAAEIAGRVLLAPDASKRWR